MRVGFIGLGHAGYPMAANLLAAGFELTVHDLERTKAEQLLDRGATWAGSTDEAARDAEAVITSLPGPSEVKSVFESRGGLLESLREGQTWIEMSTTDVGQLRGFASRLAGHGVTVLESPVTGGVRAAYERQATLFVGGAQAVFDQRRAVLDAMSSHVIYLGPLGNAMITKIITSMIGLVHDSVLGEALVLGKRAGLAPAALLDAIQSSYTGSFVADVDGPRILDGSYDVSFTADLGLKDLRLAQGLAADSNVPVTFVGLAIAALERAKASYGGDADVLMLVRKLEEDCGVRLQ